MENNKLLGRMGTGTRDMIKKCREAGVPEPQFPLTDGFVVTVRRKPGRAFEAVGGKVKDEVTGEVAGGVTGEVSDEVINLLRILVIF